MAQSGTDVPSIIISEWRGDNMYAAYVELTNMGDEQVDLSNFSGAAVSGPPHAQISGDTLRIENMRDSYFKKLEGFLQPGESYVIMNAFDDIGPEGRFWHRTQMVPEADLIIHNRDGHGPFHNVPEKETFGRDSVDESYEHLLWQWGGVYGWALYYHPTEQDSFVVDGVNLAWDADNHLIFEPSEVAGIKDASEFHILVRKSVVTQGNWDWYNARGTDLANSEWMPIPHDGFIPDGDIFTTVGRHGDFHIDMRSEVIDIDESNEKLTVPWGIIKGDSLIDEFDLGPGMAWQYTENKVDADSTSTVCQDGDTLKVFACGDELRQKDFELEIAPPADDINLVFAKRKLVYEQVDGDPSQPSLILGDELFYVTENQPFIDTIGDVPYALRVDTLFKYLEKAPNAEWKINWVDGIERPDIKRADILQVTAADGTVKEYFIAAQSVPEVSHNANLSAITWPDAPQGLRMDPKWNDDTIPSFSPVNFYYMVEVPYGQKNIPALKAIPEDLNARIQVDRATNLSGTIEDRKTSITVTAEDDTTILEYTIIFSVDLPEQYVQPYSGEPFFSQLSNRQWHRNGYIEIFNPGNQPLDLSNYMIAWGINQNPSEILKSNLGFEDWESRFSKYVPGYVYQTEVEWQSKPGYLVKDFIVNPIVEPKDVFVIANYSDEYDKNPERAEADVFMNDRNNESTWGGFINYIQSITRPVSFYKSRGALCLFKIQNDSVLLGLKPIGGDPEDYLLIDVIGNYNGVLWSPGTDTIGENISGHRWKLIRKPTVWHGDTVPNGSFGTTEEESEWLFWHWDEIRSMSFIGEGIGYHIIDPVNIYKSTVNSLVYKIDDGYEGNLNIKGISNGEDVNEFLDNIIPEHIDQTFAILSAENGVAKSMIDPVENGDTLKVISADSSNTTKYKLSTVALDDNALLTSREYTTEVDGNGGTISGIHFGTTIREVRNNLTKPEKAVLNIIDTDDNLVPLQVRNFDTTYVYSQANEYISFEVIAEDKEAKITYQLQMDITDDEAYAFSDLFRVDQELQYVSLIPKGISVQTFFTYLKANKGADMKLIDKMGFERMDGNVRFDDLVVVTSPDGSKEKIYHLNFSNENEGNEAWVVSDVFVVDQLTKTISEIDKETSINFLLNLVDHAPEASMNVIDSDGNIVTAGNVNSEYSVQVISGNGKKSVVYDLEIINSEAYVLSDHYDVNQSSLTIAGIPDNISVSYLLSRLDPVQGATMKITDADDNEVTEGMIQGDYHVYVISGDGSKSVTYDLNLTSSNGEEKYLITFTVSGQSGTIQNAVIEIDKQDLITDQNGESTIELPDGNFSYAVSATGYNMVTGYLTVNGQDRSKSILLDSKGILKDSTFTDERDGRTYKMVKIGDQIWMAENLAATKYNDGTPIPKVTNDSEWAGLSTPAYCWYDNDEAQYKDTYGALYNWYAVETGKLCPDGWHVPTDEEWKELEMHLGMSQSDADDDGWRGTDEGSQLAGNAALWENGDLENNEKFGSTGFNALPGGYRYGSSGNFYNEGSNSYWWSTTENSTYYAWNHYLFYNQSDVGRYFTNKDYGFSVRCIKNTGKNIFEFAITDGFNPLPDARLLFNGKSYNPDNNGMVVIEPERDSCEIRITREGHFAFTKNDLIISESSSNNKTIKLGQLGDYDANGLLEYNDFDLSRQAFLADEDSIEFGPVKGTVPDFTVQPDGHFDFEDFMVLAVIWRHNNLKSSDPVRFNPDLFTKQKGQSEISMEIINETAQEITYRLGAKNLKDYRSSGIIIQYDPGVMMYESIKQLKSGNMQNEFSLTRVDRKKGRFEFVHAAETQNADSLQVFTISFIKTEKQYDIPFEFEHPVCYYEIRENNGMISQGRTEVLNEIDSPDITSFSFYPNPVKEGYLQIEYFLQKESNVIIEAYNITGLKIETLVDRKEIKGEHTHRWNIANIYEGIYYIKFIAGDYQKTEKCLIVP